MPHEPCRKTRHAANFLPSFCRVFHFLRSHPGAGGPAQPLDFFRPRLAPSSLFIRRSSCSRAATSRRATARAARASTVGNQRCRARAERALLTTLAPPPPSPRRQVRRRELQAQAHEALPPLDGQRGPGHERLAGGRRQRGRGVRLACRTRPFEPIAQFFITTVVTSWLDGKHVVCEWRGSRLNAAAAGAAGALQSRLLFRPHFPCPPCCSVGEVTTGQEVVKKIESYGSDSGKTRAVIKIVDSGAL